VQPEVRVLLDRSIDKNLIDKDEYPQTAEIERRCVHMLADLWNAPADGDPVGTSGIGSSEACMLAGMAMHRRWRARRTAAGEPVDRPNLVCGPVQVVWHKFARYWDIELREVGMAPGRHHLDVESMLERVDGNTIGVVPTLGVTYTGAYEPVAELAAALDDLCARTGLDVDLHVDAASGGFTAPFCAPELVWDFRLPRVRSISASGHKFGLAPLGAGWVLWRDAADLPDELVFHVSYLGGDMPVFQLNFSRPAGQVIAQYYEFVRLGREGYAKVHGASYRVAGHVAEQLAGMGPFELVFDGDPAGGIPAVTWTLRDDAAVPWTLFDLADRLRTRGWQVPAYPLTGDLSSTIVQRALIRQDVSFDQAELLLDDVRAALAHLAAHPVSVPLAQDEAGGFHH
jgi:glutamate decarboxylase